MSTPSYFELAIVFVVTATLKAVFDVITAKLQRKISAPKPRIIKIKIPKARKLPRIQVAIPIPEDDFIHLGRIERSQRDVVINEMVELMQRQAVRNEDEVIEMLLGHPEEVFDEVIRDELRHHQECLQEQGWTEEDYEHARMMISLAENPTARNKRKYFYEEFRLIADDEDLQEDYEIPRPVGQ